MSNQKGYASLLYDTPAVKNRIRAALTGPIMTLYAIVVPIEHDASYKLLFSHARMVEDLLRGFVHEAWVGQADFTSLERVSGSYVSEDLRDREDDMIWRVRWGAEWLYIYLLLEFQATVDRSMAVRLMVYVELLWQSLIQARTLSPKVPRDIWVAVQRLETRETLHALLRQAMTCPNLEAILLANSKPLSFSTLIFGKA